MEAKIQDHSAVKDKNVPGNDSDHHNKNVEDSSSDENKESRVTQYNDVSNLTGDDKGFADRANNIGTLNEDKSTISDTSAPSASMQGEDSK